MTISEKPTVTSIVQRLLDASSISAEEAVILLKAEVDSNNQRIITIPSGPLPNQFNPPFQPYVGDPLTAPSYPQVWYSSGTDTPVGTGGKGVLNGNLTGTFNDLHKKKL